MTAAPLNVILLALAYGVWTCRVWARLLGMGLHALIGLSIILIAADAISGTTNGGIPLLGQFLINLTIFYWFAKHQDYFHR